MIDFEVFYLVFVCLFELYYFLSVGFASEEAPCVAGDALPAFALPPSVQQQEGAILYGLLPLRSKNGGYLLSHFDAVPSAWLGLTSLFGMGRGGSPTL